MALRQRWRIARWMLVGAVLAVFPVLFDPPTYTSSASFVLQSAPDPARAGLATLAGQFGVQLGGSANQSQSPDFYVSLLTSRVILAPITTDTFATSASAPASPLLDLLEIEAANPARRVELGVEALRARIVPKIASKTGVVTVNVTTPWPAVSRAVAQRLLDGVNRFNLRTRQSQASEERRFTEARLHEARENLRAAEDRLQLFLQRNRQGIQNSPQLTFENDRLQRDVGLQQQIVTSLAQAYEEVRIREVRDTPVITVIEQPIDPTRANGRGRLKRGIGGLLAGAFIGLLVAFVGDRFRRPRAADDPDAEAFRQSVVEVKSEVARLVPGKRPRAEVP